MRTLRSLKPSQLKNKVVLLRLDLNTADDWRMRASLPTIHTLLKHCHALVILSHKGRPEGYDSSLSLQPDRRRLTNLIHHPVTFIPHFRFPEIQQLITHARRGSIFMLENLRFNKAEGQGDRHFAKALAQLGDLYVNDAFAVAHRNAASVVAITRYLPSYAGLELEAEVTNLTKAIHHALQPLVLVLGGAKIDKKMLVCKRLYRKADAFLIGGLLTDEILRTRHQPKIHFPSDTIRQNKNIMDIGPKTITHFLAHIQKARTIVWNGPVGKIEEARFAKGTRAIAQAIVRNPRAFSIAGGGETVMFLKKMKLDNRFDFISTGGGAMLDFLAGKTLPGITALQSLKGESRLTPVRRKAKVMKL